MGHGGFYSPAARGLHRAGRLPAGAFAPALRIREGAAHTGGPLTCTPPAGGRIVDQAFPASMAWRASIIFCADSSMSSTRESMRETK